MRRLALVLVLLLAASSLSADCTTEICRQRVAFLDGFTAFVLAPGATADDHARAITAIRTEGGTVALEHHRLLLGWASPAIAGRLRGQHKIQVITRSPLGPQQVPPGRSPAEKRSARLGADFFNAVVTGAFATQMDLVPETLPPIEDDVDDPASSPIAPASNGGLRIEATNLNGPPWMYEFMTGRVKVEIFLLDSDGTLDPNLHSWTSNDEAIVTNPLLFACVWWANKAAARGKSLTFQAGLYLPYNQFCRTKYEPVLHGFLDDYLWVNEVMRKLDSNIEPYSEGNTRPGGWGVPEPTNRGIVLNAVDEYARQVSARHGVDHAFVAFILKNTNGQHFADGTGSFAVIGGPWTQIFYDTIGAANIGLVIQHETGHIFWACDEYSDGCSRRLCDYCEIYGPARFTLNANCANPNAIAGCASPRIGCMMKDYADHVCDPTARQIGWLPR